MLPFEDVDKTSSWSDPTISITAAKTADVDTSTAFDKKMFIEIVTGVGTPYMCIFRFVVCQQV